MSHKTIHICDRCSSYIKEKTDTITISITIPGHYSFEKGYSEYVAAAQQTRELCGQCITAFKAELNYDLSETELTSLLFRDFEDEFEKLTSEDPN